MAQTTVAPSLPLRDSTDSINAGLLGAWMLSEGGGTIAYDWSNRGTNGTYQNEAASSWQPTIFGKNFNFVRASSQWVSIPNSGVISGVKNAFTISAWVKITALPSGIYNIFHKGNLTPGFDFFELHIQNAGYLEFIVIGGGGTLDLFSTGPPFATFLGQWVHVVATYDNTIGGTYYINGVYNNNNNNTNCIGLFPDVLALGNDTVSSGRIIDGWITNVRYYSRALTANEARRLYAEPFAGIGLPYYRKFSAGSSFTWQNLQLGQRDPVWGKTEIIGY